MRKNVFAVAATLLVLAGATSADARPSRETARDSWNPFVQHSASVADQRVSTPRAKRQRVASRGRAQRVRYATQSYESRSSYSSGSHSAGPRPRAWCGWWMRTQLGGGPEYNLAANWRNYGRPSGPRVGAVVVWPHHVGMITGRSASGQWIVKSGNDGNAVRERPMSVAGAVFRSS
ncbi:MAG TPA: hypothetical protein PKE16_10085 [Hyphomicrobium sp.]|nr:hypothetical protein [Hyphomicrobium sp.]